MTSAHSLHHLYDMVDPRWIIDLFLLLRGLFLRFSIDWKVIAFIFFIHKSYVILIFFHFFFDSHWSLLILPLLRVELFTESPRWERLNFKLWSQFFHIGHFLIVSISTKNASIHVLIRVVDLERGRRVYSLWILLSIHSRTGYLILHNLLLCLIWSRSSNSSGNVGHIIWILLLIVIEELLRHLIRRRQGSKLRRR